MSIVIILEQMAVMALMVLLGCGLRRKGFLDDALDKKISELVIDVCNPAMVLSCVTEDEFYVKPTRILQAVIISAAIYLLLIMAGFLIGGLLKIKKEDRRFYYMMTVYTNVGFIGIPLAKVLLDSEAMIYVVVFNVMYNVFFYTHGYHVMGVPRKTAGKFYQNIGLLSGMLTIVIACAGVGLPGVLASAVGYIGNATTFLAMILLGASVSVLGRNLFQNSRKMYLYILIKMVLLPAGMAEILKLTGVTGSMVCALTLMLSMPAANMPLMLAERQGDDTRVLSQGILATTLVSFFTIPAVMGLIM